MWTLAHFYYVDIGTYCCVFITLLQKRIAAVMNPVATHHTAHHPWTTSPIMHCTHTFPSTITPITQLSPFTHHSDCLTTPAPQFTHSHKCSTQTLTQCEVLFCPGYISERFFPVSVSLFVTPGLPDLGLLNLCLWPRPLPGMFTSLLCLRYSCYALWPLPVWFCLCPINIYYCTWIPAFDQSLQRRVPPHTRLNMWC